MESEQEEASRELTKQALIKWTFEYWERSTWFTCFQSYQTQRIQYLELRDQSVRGNQNIAWYQLQREGEREKHLKINDVHELRQHMTISNGLAFTRSCAFTRCVEMLGYWIRHSRRGKLITKSIVPLCRDPSPQQSDSDGFLVVQILWVQFKTGLQHERWE